MAGCHARATYVPRSTQDCDAVAIVREHRPAFRERVELHAGPMPGFVKSRGVCPSCMGRRMCETASLRTCQKVHRLRRDAQAYKDVADVLEVMDRTGIAPKVAKLAPLAVVKG